MKAFLGSLLYIIGIYTTPPAHAGQPGDISISIKISTQKTRLAQAGGVIHVGFIVTNRSGKTLARGKYGFRANLLNFENIPQFRSELLLQAQDLKSGESSDHEIVLAIPDQLLGKYWVQTVLVINDKDVASSISIPVEIVPSVIRHIRERRMESRSWHIFDTGSYLYAGVGIAPVTKWHSIDKEYTDALSTAKLIKKFQDNHLTTYEGILCDKQWGLNLGVYVTVDDNLVGKVHNIAGVLGSKNRNIRVQQGYLRGVGRWAQTTYNSFGAKEIISREFLFNNSYVNVEAFYSFDKLWGVDDVDIDLGVGYSRFTLPVQIGGLYDPDLKVKAYYLFEGTDSMRWGLVNPKSESTEKWELGSGFGTWAFTRARGGFGTGTTSADARRQAIQAKTPLKNSFTLLMVQGEAVMGVRWQHLARSGRGIALGIGYMGGVMLFDALGKEEAQPHFGLTQYGPVMRLAALF